MPGLKKIMIIRHGEKPTFKHQPPFGVNQDGEQDWESLTVRGWLRAAGLRRLFNPVRDHFPADALDRPALIYASAPRDPGVALEQNQASKSKRPLQTITPLAQELNVAPVVDFGKGQEAALARQVLAQSGVILISWQHEAIGEIARNLVAGGEPKATIPAQWPDKKFDIVWIFEPPPRARVAGSSFGSRSGYCLAIRRRDKLTQADRRYAARQSSPSRCTLPSASSFSRCASTLRSAARRKRGCTCEYSESISA